MIVDALGAVMCRILRRARASAPRRLNDDPDDELLDAVTAQELVTEGGYEALWADDALAYAY